MWRTFVFGLLCVLAGQAFGQTPTPDPVGDNGPRPAIDCVGLASLIRLCRDFSIPAQDAKVDAAFELWLVKSEERAVAYAAWRDCSPADYPRLKLAWEAASLAADNAHDKYEDEKLLLKQFREVLVVWILEYKDGGC